MSDLKTKPNQQSVFEFIDSVEPEWKRDDALEILNLMKHVTKEEPMMWGNSLVGFGKYHYKYKSGREGDWFVAGFSPRKQNMSVYIMGGFENQEDLLAKLGKHKTSVGCLYFKRLEDIDHNVLIQVISRSIETVNKRYADYN
ncbi:DUF1801 domain-containing protein [Ekhidna sp.]|uniref:DUF1801 domain-containing protein n=1 Tax=Ekhidna sp. TaxID=2608089 RepID=UPI003B504546